MMMSSTAQAVLLVAVFLSVSSALFAWGIFRMYARLAEKAVEGARNEETRKAVAIHRLRLKYPGLTYEQAKEQEMKEVLDAARGDLVAIMEGIEERVSTYSEQIAAHEAALMDETFSVPEEEGAVVTDSESDHLYLVGDTDDGLDQLDQLVQEESDQVERATTPVKVEHPPDVQDALNAARALVGTGRVQRSQTKIK